MLQEKYKDNVKEVSEGAVSTGFSIEVNESMFQMLTAKVYNDPILAVIREWSTNACDACIEGEKDINFDVHLPTDSELFFSVRDYGTGLAPEDIIGLFSNLGASTKRNSNALNGTFGIGRMAGLAVSSGFSVDSYFNGKLYSYAISVQKGVPVTISLGETETTEPNGLKLSVQVDEDDSRHFISKAKNLYKYFDHKPNLNIELDINLDVTEHISDDWFVSKSTDPYNYSNYIVMSQVPYLIPQDSKIDTKDFRNLIIKAEPGSVSFNPGRESLSLTKETVEYINNRFVQIENEYQQAAIVAMAQGNNDKEVYEIYRKVCDTAPRGVAREIDPKPFYSPYMTALANNDYSNYIYDNSDFSTQANNKLQLSHKGSYYKTAKLLDSNASIAVNEFFNSRHVIVNQKTSFRAACNLEFASTSVVYWTRKNKGDLEEAVEEAIKALDAMGITYDLSTEITEKHKSSITSSIPNAPREGFYTSCINNYTGDFSRSQKMDDSAITEKTYLYVKLHNTTPLLESSTIDFDGYKKIYDLFKKTQGMPEIRGVPKKYLTVAEQLDNWLDFEDFIVEVAKNTEIRVPLEVDLPYMDHRAIDDNLVYLYPRKFQDYYLELHRYKTFNSHPSATEDTHLISLLEILETPTYTYTPEVEVDLLEIQTTYPKTLAMLGMNTYYTNFTDPAKFISEIAALEESYALRSTR